MERNRDARAGAFRVVLLTAHSEDRDLRSLVRHLASVPGVAVAGVVRGPARAPFARRMRAYVRRHGVIATAFNAGYLVWRRAITLAGVPLALAFRLAHPLRPAPSLGALLMERGIPEVRVDDFHGATAIAALRALDADLGVVYGTPILRSSVFSVPKQGCINLHTAELPRYRGAGLVGLSEVLDGRTEVGVSVHRVDAGLDTGAVLARGAVPIEPLDTLRSLAVKATLTGQRLLATTVASLRDGLATAPPPAHDEVFPLRRSLGRLTLLRRQREFRRRLPPRSLTLREAARTVLGGALLCSGYVQARNAWRRARGRVPVTVLYYHLISDRPHQLGLSTDAFIDHLEHLTRYYRVTRLDAAVEALRSGDVGEPLLAVTFDDGYAENMRQCRDLCALYEVPVTFFVCSSLVAAGLEFPDDGNRGVSGFPAMTVADLRTLLADGHEIGSHTCSHADCGDPRNWPEIAASRHELEAMLDRPVTSFSFPYGAPENCPPGARPVIEAAKYGAAFSAFGGINYVGADLLALRRIPAPLMPGALQLEAVLQGWPTRT